ncbi:hypothetical protein F5B20DRAFT_535931, partial [Whalleya microplaca]
MDSSRIGKCSGRESDYYCSMRRTLFDDCCRHSSTPHTLILILVLATTKLLSTQMPHTHTPLPPRIDRSSAFVLIKHYYYFFVAYYYCGFFLFFQTQKRKRESKKHGQGV